MRALARLHDAALPTAPIGPILRRCLPWAGVIASAVTLLSVSGPWRGLVLLGLVVTLWAVNAFPDFAVGFGRVATWNLLGIGRPEVSLSGQTTALRRSTRAKAEQVRRIAASLS